jgi:hypothetical protein
MYDSQGTTTPMWFSFSFAYAAVLSTVIAIYFSPFELVGMS